MPELPDDPYTFENLLEPGPNKSQLSSNDWYEIRTYILGDLAIALAAILLSLWFLSH